MARRSELHRGFREAMGMDHSVVAQFVDIWRHPRNVGSDHSPFEQGTPETPVSLNDIAWETGHGASKIAITMKYAEKNGWVRRTNARTEQAEYEPTQKALDQYPDNAPQVMPDLPSTSIAPGLSVSGASREEIDSWNEDAGYVRIDRPRRGPDRLPRETAEKQFKGYLTEGDDE